MTTDEIKTAANSYQALYQSALLENVIPFWMNHSIDSEYGGFFTCLDETGQVYDTDKFSWLQFRQVWTFSMLYNQLEANPAWLEIAQYGARFMIQHAQSPSGAWYFSLTRAGKPLIQPYNIFSDCFAAQGLGQLFKATQDEVYAQLARSTFDAILKRRDNPKGIWNKAYPDTRPLQNFALPMILCNLALELEHLLSPSLVSQLTETCMQQVMHVFYDETHGLIRENVLPDGSFSDSFDGRLLNPGHAIEAMWFIMDIAEPLGDTKTIKKAKDIILNTLEFAWDKEFGGLFYFMDIKNAPPQQLEWDQKLWWVHQETLIALLKAYYLTGDMACWQWFEKVHHYAWPRFFDDKNGEWFGYLNRAGIPHLRLKGGKWKGCYHTPRAMFKSWKMLEKIVDTGS